MFPLCIHFVDKFLNKSFKRSQLDRTPCDINDSIDVTYSRRYPVLKTVSQ